MRTLWNLMSNFECQPGFSDTWLSGQHNNSTVALHHVVPKLDDIVQLLKATDQLEQSRLFGKSTLEQARLFHAPGLDRLGEAFQRMQSHISVLERTGRRVVCTLIDEDRLRRS